MIKKTANEINLEILINNTNIYMPYLTKILKSQLMVRVLTGKTVYNDLTGKFVSHTYVIEHWNKDKSKLYHEIFTGTDKECIKFIKKNFDIEKLKEGMR